MDKAALPNSLQTQDFVRGLKAPENSDGPPKIAWVCQIWEADTPALPNKGEIITEWILSSMLLSKADNNREAQVTLNDAIFDRQYWCLLAEVISVKSDIPWLPTLSRRLSFVSIATIFFRSFSSRCIVPSPDIMQSFYTVMRKVWPLIREKTSTDNLLECTCSMLALVAVAFPSILEFPSSKGLFAFLSEIVMLLKNVLDRTSNKKKVFSVICEKYIMDWMTCIAAASNHHVDNISSLHDFCVTVEHTFLDIGFSKDVLKGLSGPQNVFDVLDHFISRRSTIQTGVIVDVMPKIFRRFTHVLLHNDGPSLFNRKSKGLQSVSLRERTKEAAKEGFTRCCKILQKFGDADGVLQGIVMLLETIQHYSMSCIESANDPGVVDICNLAVGALAAGKSNETALRILTALASINLDIILPSIPSIFLLLTSLPNDESGDEKSPYFQQTCASFKYETDVFIRTLLDHHIKRRQMGQFIKYLLEYFSTVSPDDSTISRLISDSVDSNLCDCFPVYAMCYSDEFRSAICIFLTSAQRSAVINDTFEELKKCWESFHLSGLSHVVNKVIGVDPDFEMRSKATPKDQHFYNEDRNVLKFLLLSGIHTAILSSLSAEQLLQAPPNQLILDAIRAMYNDLMRPAFHKCFSLFELYSNSPKGLSLQLTLVGLLRMHRALLTNAMEVPGFSNAFAISWPSSNAVNVILDGQDITPDLTLEFHEYVIFHLASNLIKKDDFNEVVDSIVLCSKKPLAKMTSVMYHLLSDQWLQLLDEFATIEQLTAIFENLIQLFALPGSLSNNMVGESRDLSAVIWDLPNIKIALLRIMSKKLLHMDKILQTTGKESYEQISSEQLETLSQTYGFLLRCPAQYAPRLLCKDFVRRAIQADMILTGNGHELIAEDSAWKLRLCGSIRIWLTRTVKSLVCCDLLFSETAKYVVHLLQTIGLSSIPRSFILVTLTLVKCAYEYAVQEALHDNIGYFLHIVNQYLSDLLTVNILQLPETKYRSLLVLITIIMDQGNSLRIYSSTILRDSLERLHGLLERSLACFNTVELLGADSYQYLRVWKVWHSFSKWMNLGNSTNKAYPLSAALLRLLQTENPYISSQRDEFYLEVFASLCEHAMGDISDPEVIAASYIHIRLNFTQKSLLDDVFLNFTKSLSVDQLSQLITAVARSYEKARSDEILHLHFLMLLSSSNGATKVLRDSLEQSLTTFIDSKFCNMSITACLDVLQILAKFCYQRAGLLKPCDIGITLLLLNRLTAHSTFQEAHTNADMFHVITVIANVLLRFRQDLVLDALPLYSLVLRQLLSCLCTQRPGLGKKQRRAFNATLPWWINSLEPLGEIEAKAFTRLLTALSARKTLSRTTHGSEIRIAKSFSKHAPYILTTYATVMTNPFCYVHSDVLRELRPGLYSMCSIITEHVRDTMMHTIVDPNQKHVLKELWKSYSKQKYIGRG